MKNAGRLTERFGILPVNLLAKMTNLLSVSTLQWRPSEAVRC